MLICIKSEVFSLIFLVPTNVRWNIMSYKVGVATSFFSLCILTFKKWVRVSGETDLQVQLLFYPCCSAKEPDCLSSCVFSPTSILGFCVVTAWNVLTVSSYLYVFPAVHWVSGPIGFEFNYFPDQWERMSHVSDLGKKKKTSRLKPYCGMPQP